MKKILMLSTGGTIASQATEDGLMPAVQGNQMIQMIPQLKDLCEIHVKEVLKIDSTNMQPEEWQLIANQIHDYKDQYDGIVITHGTDTMAYTAAALSFLLQQIEIPVVLTGSQQPIEAPDTDGKRNIYDAFCTALEDSLKGVYIVFDGIIIRGLNGKKVRSHTYHAFESINYPEVGFVQNGTVVINEFYQLCQNKEDKNYQFYKCLDTNVVLYKLFPGIQPSLLEYAISVHAKAVVLEAYGIGGITNERRNLLKVIQELSKLGVLVIVTTQCMEEGCDLNVYEVGVEALKAGAISAGMMTTEAILAKTMWVLGQTNDQEEAKSLFLDNIVGEFDLIDA